MLGALLPKHPNVPFDVVNKLMTKKEISAMIDAVYRHCGQKETVIFCDRIMALGFHHAFKAGISFGKDDMVVPENKWSIVEETRALAKEYEQQYKDGLITQGEKYNKVVDAWAKCSDRLADEMMKRISTVKKDENGRDKPVNSIYMMSHSGRARLAGADEAARRHARPDGQAVGRDHREPDHLELQGRPRRARVLQLDARRPQGPRRHGAEDGELRLSDPPPRRRGAGRVIREPRLRLGARHQHARHRRRRPGRGLARARASSAARRRRTSSPSDGKVIVPKGTMIEEEHIEAINAAGIQEVKIRSVLVCESKNGVCATCYGRDLARGTPVNMGEAVGVIAAQSIGEPGTQLTMRTFHIGGAAQIADQSFIESNFEGTVRIRNRNAGAQLRRRPRRHGPQRGRRHRRAGRHGAGGAPHPVRRAPEGRRGRQDQARPAHRRVGSLHPSDPHRGRRHRRPTRTSSTASRSPRPPTKSTGITKRVVDRLARLRPTPRICKPGDRRPGQGRQDREAARAAATPASSCRSTRSSRVDPGAKVKAGDVLARVSTESAKTRDITGGLPRVAELFEARRPKDAAIIAEKSGTIQFGRDYKNKRRLSLTPHDGSEPVEYLIPKGKHIHLQDGDVVEIGDFIVDGNPAPHDILAIKGVEELAAYLVNEIQEVYRLQGVSINDKHIEVIVRQMLQKVEITEAGDSELLTGEQVDRLELEEVNEELVAEGKKPAAGVPVLLGITKAWLQTRSFISAASFQETTRVLTEAAVNGKVDTLEGLKENVIVGSLIPAGTGAMSTQIKQVASRRDELILAQKAAEQEAMEAACAVEELEELPSEAAE